MVKARVLIGVASVGVGLSLAIALYYFSFASPLMQTLARWTAQSLGGSLNFLGTDATVSGVVVASQRFSVEIVPECTSVGPLLLFLGAVLGYPSSLPAKVKGALLGIIALTLVNYLRVIALFSSAATSPAALR